MIGELFKELEERPFKKYLIDQSLQRRTETFQTRDKRYREVDRILRGEFKFKTPAGDVIEGPPVVTNLADTFTRDVSRLVTEMKAGIRAPLLGDKKQDEKSGAMREMAAMTYWTRNRGDLLESQLATDLIANGAAYLYTWVDQELDVPHIGRFDPRVCYPTIHNGILSDLYVVQSVPADVAEALYPGKGIKAMVKDRGKGDEVEIHDYLSSDFVVRLICAAGKNPRALDADFSILVDPYVPPGGCLPVAYAQLTSFDGAQRGLLDQILGSLEAKNKIAALLLKNLEDMVFTPFLAQNILNPDDTPDEDTIYEADPNAEKVEMSRIQAAQPNQTLYALMSGLDADQRALIGYPESRSGVVGQSIASGSFVDATQGMLSTTTKNIQEHIADMREQIHIALAKYDVAYLDNEKPLVAAVNDVNVYKPSEVWADKVYEVAVSYGPNAGLSRGQSDVRDLQFLGAGVVGKRTVREHVGEGYLKDRMEEQDAINLEEGESALSQLFWSDPQYSLPIKMAVLRLMRDKGMTLDKAVEKAIEDDAKAQAGTSAAETEQQLMSQSAQPEAAATPAALPQELAFADAPRSQYFVNSEG